MHTVGRSGRGRCPRQRQGSDTEDGDDWVGRHGTYAGLYRWDVHTGGREGGVGRGV